MSESLGEKKAFFKRILARMRRDFTDAQLKRISVDRMGNSIQKLHPSFEEKGRGAYATVIQLSWDVVVKVCNTKQNQNYLEYARYCQRNHKNNPILPKIYQISTLGNCSLIFMERLFEFNSNSVKIDPNSAIKELDKNFFNFHYKNKKSTKANTTFFNVPQVKMNQVIGHISNMIDNRKNCRIDFHTGNVLVRVEGPIQNLKRQLVISDPVGN